MFKKTITYRDFNDKEQTKTLYFNLTRTEILEMENSETGGYGEMIKKVVDSKDGATIMKVFKTIILKSYGVKTEDGEGFDKGEELSKAFEHSAAFDALFIELCTNAEEATNFITHVMPLNDEQRKEIANKVTTTPLIENK